MARVWTLVGTLLLAGVVTLAQSDSAQLSGLDQRLTDAHAALDRAAGLSAVDRSSLERELRNLEDEVAYLRVKSRKGERIDDRETRDLGERIDRFVQRTNDRNYNSSTSPGTSGPSRGRVIPINTELDVRLQTPLNSGTAQVEQRVEATTMVNLYREDDLIVPAGSLLVGYVASVEPATRTDRKGKMSLQFTRLTVNQRSYDVRVSVTQAIESKGIKDRKSVV